MDRYHKILNYYMMPLWVGDQVGFQHGLIPTSREHIRSLETSSKKKPAVFPRKHMTWEMIGWKAMSSWITLHLKKKMQTCWKIPHHQLFVDKQTTQGEWLPRKAGGPIWWASKRNQRHRNHPAQPCHDVRNCRHWEWSWDAMLDGWMKSGFCHQI